MSGHEGIIRAAGVVCLRERPGGYAHGDPEGLEVLIIHRTQIKDWSLPKGKLERGEHITVAAVRETWEETGHHVVLGAPLPLQRYQVGSRPKTVHYWVGRVTGRSAWSPNREIDDVQWVPVQSVDEALTYPHDAELVRAAATAPRGTSPLVIVRHAQAEKRSDYARTHPDGIDSERPLTRMGERQAQDLTLVLSAYGITEVHSSPSARCWDSVLPYATHAGIDAEAEPLLSEEGFAEHPDLARARLSALIHHPAPQAVCTHRPVLPAVATQVAEETGAGGLDAALPPGGLIVVHRQFMGSDDSPVPATRVVATERHAP